MNYQSELKLGEYETHISARVVHGGSDQRENRIRKSPEYEDLKTTPETAVLPSMLLSLTYFSKLPSVAIAWISNQK